jgi:ribosome recycling factor
MIPQELQSIIDQAAEKMDDSVTYFKNELLHVRAGSAQTSLLDGIKVDYYGAQTPLNQLANVSAPEARLLTVEPYDKTTIEAIEKAIMAGGLGLNPNNDGNIIRIPLPLLSEERRKELVKHVKDIAEETHISIRNERHEANQTIEKTVKSESFSEDAQYEAEQDVQEITDTHTKTVDELLEKKEEEILTV